LLSLLRCRFALSSALPRVVVVVVVVVVTGLLGRDEVIEMFRKTKKGFIASDEEIKLMEEWLVTSSAAHYDPMDKIELCRLGCTPVPLSLSRSRLV
jgi:hypothetical protein